MLMGVGVKHNKSCTACEALNNDYVHGKYTSMSALYLSSSPTNFLCLWRAIEDSGKSKNLMKYNTTF